jgi:DNA repair exonuclease SbcCD ATPase subunit
MIITKLTANNFGKHAKIEFDTHESVVGIIGPNGSGKSTLLDLLKFLFTSILEDNAESYIRTGAKKAEGEAHFIQNGQPGRIYRKITASSSSRELEWNGETSTKDLDVATKLAAILGADKHAISNAVFIPQGELDKILFGNQADREKLFTRLVNVAFLEKTVGVLDTKIKQESASTEDLTSVVDELRVQVAVAGGNVQDIELEYRMMENVTPKLSFLRRMHDLTQQHAALQTKRGAAENAAIVHGMALQSALDLAGISSYEALQLKEQAVQAKYNQAHTHHTSLVLGQKTKDLRSKQRADLDALDMTLIRQNGRRSDLEMTLAGVDLMALYNQLQSAEKRQVVAAECKRLDAECAAAMAEVTDHSQKPTPDAGVLNILRTEGESLASVLGGLDLSLNALKLVVGKPCGDRCPVCAQHIDSAIISPSRLQELQTERDRQAFILTSKRQAYAKLDQEIKTHTQTTQNLSAKYVRLIQEHSKWVQQLSSLPAGDASDIKARYQQATALTAELKELKTSITTLETRRAQVANWEFTPEDLARAEKFTEAALGLASDALEACKEEQKELTQLRNTVAHLWSAKTKAEAEAKACLDQETSAANTLLDHQRNAPTNIAPYELIDVPGSVAACEGHERKRQECAGRLTQARDQLKVLQKRDLELAERLHKNSIRMQVVEDLRRLRDTFSRGGLPMAYVEYQFRRLITLAQRNLTELGANFTIEVNPERPVAFSFTRLDETQSEALDMVKLSGGQRVKLSIAFLIAVQQLLIPEVGLLVLDEPSTHLDEESVEALKGLLMSMTQTLQNASQQVWVVDHHTNLQPAFGACLQLT